MKRLFFLVLIGFALISCQKEETNVNTIQLSQDIMSQGEIIANLVIMDTLGQVNPENVFLFDENGTISLSNLQLRMLQESPQSYISILKTDKLGNVDLFFIDVPLLK